MANSTFFLDNLNFIIGGILLTLWMLFGCIMYESREDDVKVIVDARQARFKEDKAYRKALVLDWLAFVVLGPFARIAVHYKAKKARTYLSA